MAGLGRAKVKAEGLRARKRRQTRERITRAAMTLFLERGFDAATVDDIAAAADVSKRSFFDYFPTKEDVIFAWQDEFGTALAAAVAGRPTGEPLPKVVEEALTSTIAAAADPQTLAIGRFIRDTPALRARDQLKYAKLEQQLADALAVRTRGKDEQLRARLIAMVAIGVLRVGGETWLAGKTRLAGTRTETVEAFARWLFKTIWAELRGIRSRRR